MRDSIARAARMQSSNRARPAAILYSRDACRAPKSLVDRLLVPKVLTMKSSVRFSSSVSVRGRITAFGIASVWAYACESEDPKRWEDPVPSSEIGTPGSAVNDPPVAMGSAGAGAEIPAGVDPWKNSSLLLADYAAMLQLLAEPYPSALGASSSGKPADVATLAADLDRHAKSTRELLASAAACEDE